MESHYDTTTDELCHTPKREKPLRLQKTMNAKQIQQVKFMNKYIVWDACADVPNYVLQIYFFRFTSSMKKILGCEGTLWNDLIPW